MSLFAAIRHRLRSALRPASADQERAEEYAFHQNLEAQQREHSGADPGDARAAAKRDFGNATYLKEEVRWMGAARWLDAIGQDLRYGVRALRRSPGFSAVAVLSLGLGIGANAVIFGAIQSLVLKKVGAARAHELRMLSHSPQGTLRAFFSNDDVIALRTAQSVDLTGMRAMRVRGLEANGASVPDPGIDAVDGAFFSLLGVRAAVGRVIGASDVDGAAPVAVVSHRFATANFGSPAVAHNKVIKLDGESFTIVGVTRANYEGLSFGSDYGVAIPETAIPQAQLRAQRGLGEDAFIVTRFRGDSARVQAALTAVFSACCADRAPADGPPGARRLGFIDISHGINEGKKSDPRTQYGGALTALFAGVAVLLLIACTNVANLLMARANARGREQAVRLSLGASRLRIVRQLLVEALLLALCGGAAGLALAVWGSAFIARNLPAGTASLGPFLALRPTLSILGFTAAIAFACALAFGVIPALRATRRSVVAGLREGRVRGTSIFERGIVALQVGLALLLVTSSGLLVATLKHLSDSVGGSNPETLLVVQLDSRGTPHSDTALHLAVPSLQQRLRAIPGIKSIAESYVVPLIYGGLPTGLLDVAGFEGLTNDAVETANFGIGPGYFSTLGVRLIAGRDFSDGDVVGTERVAIISENVANQFFPGRNPIGEVIGFRGSGRNLRIVGVVGDTKQTNLRAPAQRTVYVPFAQEAGFGDRAVFAVRTTIDPATIIPAARAAILAELPNIRIRHLHPMSALLSLTIARERTLAGLSVAFGLLAVLLAAVGLYGVMAFQVSARTREIGVRMALGAGRAHVVRMVIRQALTLVAVGVAIGVPFALAGARSLRALLYGIAPFDPLPLAIGAAVLLVVGAVAALLPSRYAARVDPLVAMRAE